MPFLLGDDAAQDLQDLRQHWRAFARERLAGGHAAPIISRRQAEYVLIQELVDADIPVYSGVVQVYDAEALTWTTVSDTVYVIDANAQDLDVNKRQIGLRYGSTTLGGDGEATPVFVVNFVPCHDRYRYYCIGGKLKEYKLDCDDVATFARSLDVCCECSGSGSGSGPWYCYQPGFGGDNRYCSDQVTADPIAGGPYPSESECNDHCFCQCSPPEPWPEKLCIRIYGNDACAGGECDTSGYDGYEFDLTLAGGGGLGGWLQTWTGYGHYPWNPSLTGGLCYLSVKCTLTEDGFIYEWVLDFNLPGVGCLWEGQLDQCSMPSEMTVTFKGGFGCPSDATMTATIDVGECGSGSGSGIGSGSGTGSGSGSGSGTGSDSGSGTGSGSGGCATANTCCPDCVPTTLTATVTNKTGSLTCLPDSFTLNWNGSGWVSSFDLGSCCHGYYMTIGCNAEQGIFVLNPNCVGSFEGPSNFSCNPFHYEAHNITCADVCGSAGTCDIVITE